MSYDYDYPSEPIGGSNPYYCCSYCKISEPQLNGRLFNHLPWCEYRKQKELQLQLKKDTKNGQSYFKLY